MTLDLRPFGIAAQPAQPAQPARPPQSPVGGPGVIGALRGLATASDKGDTAGIWFVVGGPILSLLLVFAIVGLALLHDMAAERDRAFVESSRSLVGEVLRAEARAMRGLTTEYAVWEAAYENISLAPNADWQARNLPSPMASGVFVLGANGEVRFSTIAEDTLRAEALIAAIGVAFRPSRLAELAAMRGTPHAVATSLVVVDGELVKVGLGALHPASAPTQPSSAPVVLIALAHPIGAADLAEQGRALGLDDLAFSTTTGGSGRIHRQVVDDRGVRIGWLAWRDQRPGTAAFEQRLGWILLGLGLIGFATIHVAQSQVARQIRIHTHAQEAAESASRSKSHFLAAMSHELRTPLNAVIGYSELIQEAAREAGRVQESFDAGRIRNAGEHLLTLINGLLDHAKIEAGQMDIHLQPVNVGDVIAEVDELIRPRIVAGGNQLELAIAADIGPVLADRMRLKQCLLNLASNAAKFTNQGVVTISASQSVGATGRVVEIAVHDSGVGIAPEGLAKLFQPFAQAEKDTSSRFGGTGLGLVITRSLMIAMGGDVRAQSTPGEGSVFTLWLPAPTSSGSG